MFQATDLQRTLIPSAGQYFYQQLWKENYWPNEVVIHCLRQK